ncbi:Hypothetical protein SMAX5B_015584 [Scophthalmus maximus]|uniref:Uncharacterized protein n=1 Tax=Scophthalmus maximus TaxID=52904 RepID=A0A2U9CXR9_SCOMX|nr:uncharacterized protein si:ch211-81a5.8 isoform X1 [Scophthalmus maximus]XP_035476366.1 uncharacterized protein si:ch211-81a5.8 isoform X1 [Scophthalmus maximus]AWP21485.1 Hypothetical protein SMAX5B_015584 [Scophthalmus maximus]
MDSLMSLGSPLKQFTSCVSGKKSQQHNQRAAKGSQSVRRSSFTRRKSVSRRRSLPCSSQKVPDSWLRAYQDELKRERKRQQAILAKKNTERTVRKTHFRSHHCLPRQTATARKPAAAKDDSFFGAFQGLSLDGLMGGNRGSAAAPAGGDQCKVM